MKKNRRLSGKEKAQYIGILILYPFLLLFGWMGKTMKLFGTRRRQLIASVLSFAILLAMLPVTVLAAPVNIAAINGTGYETLQAAVNAAQSGQTIELLENISLTASVSIDGGNANSFAIDLNGKTLNSGSVSAINHGGSGTLGIKDTAGSGKITSASVNGAINLLNNGSSVAVTGGTIITQLAIDNLEGGTVSVSGGTLKAYTPICNRSNGSVSVTGGIVECISPTSAAISNDGTGTVSISGGVVKNTAGGVAMYNADGKITVSGSALVTGSSTLSHMGTIFLVTSSSATALEISGGTIENTSTGNAIRSSGSGKIVIPSGSSVIRGGLSAMNTAPDLSAYADVKISASAADAQGGDAAVITNETLAAGIATYKYLKFEPASGAPVAEQFNLTPGGTYYFDLSGEKNIGTVNPALPDWTLHYVPFTYAGTVNAYSLTEALATTAEYAAANQSPRSLFVGDYNIGTGISWNRLNTADLIFGKTFDTNYKLRSLSAGSSHKTSGDFSGQPDTNEWDQIITKSGSIDNMAGWIKNWNGVTSWGQDTVAVNTTTRAMRGYDSAYTWGSSLDTDYSAGRGFRPALEVMNPAALGADGLKAVTLNLNSGKLNNSADNINIICAGNSFKAPDGEGLTAPVGKEFAGWKDTNSTATYNAGAVVPSTVTGLTAQWEIAPIGSLTENLDDISTLSASGWTMKNNSAPVGSTSWFQGTPTSAAPTPGPFNSYNGAANAYIAANFNSTGNTGTISNWLITPKLSLTNGSTLTFYTRKAAIGNGQTDYPDRLEVRMSASGANPGTGAADTGDFTTLLLSVNPDLAKNVYPQEWTKYTATVSGLTEPINGYLAFRYFVTGAGPMGSNSDYIGIDAVSYKARNEQAALYFAGGTPTVKTYADEPFNLTATGGSGTGELSYSVVSGPATINGNTVTLTGVGTIVLRATKAGDDDYIDKSVEHTITVNPKPVTIVGVTAQSKVYDGNKTASISGTAEIAGKVSGDAVSVSGGSAAFADKTVSNGKTVTFTGFTLTGADADKYTLSAQPADVTANITAKPITMNVTIQNKAYDGLNTAMISGASLNGIAPDDTVSLVTPYPTAAFAGVSVADSIPVSFGGSFTLTGANAGNYTLTQPSGITGNIINNYIAVKGTDYTVNRTGWGNTDFVVTAKPGFELSQSNSVSGAWSNTLTKSDETASDIIIFYVRNKTTGAISTAAAESYQIDKTAPTGDIKKGTSSIKKALNTITFGLFFKDTQSITITSADTGSGVASVVYKRSSVILEEAAVEEISDWTVYTGAFTVEPNSKTVVYAKITDTAGNVTYLGSDGLVLFTDSTANTASVSFTKKSGVDVPVSVNLNGNTVKEVLVGTTSLTENMDYTANGGTITLKAAYLDTLTAGNHTVLIDFYPLGENADYGLGSGANKVSIPLTVSKAIPALSVTVSPTGSQTRPGSVTLSANLPTGATGTLQFTANGSNIGAPVSVGQTVTFNASGSVDDYAFMVYYSGDTNYAAADASAPPYSFVKGEQSALSFAAGTPTAKTYGDNAFTVTATGGSGTGTISYSVVSGPAEISGNTVTLTGTGSIVLRATKAADDDYNAKSVETTIVVGKKSVTITGVTAQSKVYDGNKTAAVSGTAVLSGKVGGDAVSVLPGTAAFADKTVGNDKIVSFTGFALTGAEAGNYTLSAQPADATANITAKPIIMNVTIQDKAYDGLNTAIIASASLNNIVSGDTVNLASLYPAATFASVSAATGIPVSFGGNFTLTGADAGNYTLTQPSGITGNITNSYNAVKGTDYTVSTTQWSKTNFIVTAKTGFELSLTDTAGGAWSDLLTKSDETASGIMTFYVRNKTTGAISLAVSESYRIDKTAPTGDIKIGGGSIKKALNAITFGLFFKDTQSITITSADTGSGVASVSYKLSSAVLDETAVREISDWTAYTGTFTVEPDSQRIVYVKITDTAGNVLYLGSDGLVLDGTAPVISGIENGKAYCAAVTVAVTDANLDTVTVNGTDRALTDGKLTLSPTGAEQTVIATDKAGNSTMVKVTVYDGHAWDEGVVITAPTASKKGVKAYTCTHCGETKTEEIAMLAPSVTEGQNGSWKPDAGGALTFQSDAAFSDFISVLVDGKAIDAKHYELKEGSIIVTLKADYLATLPAGTHTLGIQSAAGIAATEFTVAAKAEDKGPSNPGDTKLPQTGDNSNSFLWIALLFVSGGALAVFGKSRKRKLVK